MNPIPISELPIKFDGRNRRLKVKQSTLEPELRQHGIKIQELGVREPFSIQFNNNIFHFSGPEVYKHEGTHYMQLSSNDVGSSMLGLEIELDLPEKFQNIERISEHTMSSLSDSLYTNYGLSQLAKEVADAASSSAYDYPNSEAPRSIKRHAEKIEKESMQLAQRLGQLIREIKSHQNS